ncbi:MAG: hypothetical protein PUK83_00210, partial [Clostridia bacterium]|nr:hypothetical protein [Clostridia bacterium]
MRKLSKGYGKFAFMLLVFAMCLTAFVVTPFYNTQTYALPYSNKTPSITKSRYTASEISSIPGSASPEAKEFRTFFDTDGGAPLTKNGKTYFGGNKQELIDTGCNDRGQLDAAQGMQFLPNYYDLATGDGIFNKKTLTKDTFTTGNFVQTVNLADMINHFGIGTGVTIGYGKRNGANITVTNGADATNVAEQWIRYYADGASHEDGHDEQRDWRRANGYFYTYIKVPTELANSLTVSASARMQCQGWHAGSKGIRSLLVLDLQVGNIQGNNYGPGDFTKANSSQYVSPDKNDSGSDVGDKNIRRSTGSVALNGSTWIKLSATVLTSDGTYANSGLNPAGKDWNNSLLLQEVQLEFTYTSPYLAPTYTVDKANEFTKDNKSVDLELYYQLNGDWQNNYKVEIYKVNGNISTYKGEALPRNDVSVDTDTTNNKRKYTLRFSGLDENGQYEARLTSKSGSTKFETVRFTVAKIDKGAPSEATMSIDSWFTTNDANREITISNIRDTSHDGTMPSGVDYINLYLKKVDDTYTFNKADLNNFATNAEGRLENKTISGTTYTFKLSDIISDLFTAEDKTAKYGRYVLFYQVRDKVGNMSEYYGLVIDYDNGAVIDIDKFMLSQGEPWVTNEVFGNNWITGGKIYVKFNLTETYHFKPNFEFSNESGNTIAFNDITITLAKEEVKLDNLDNLTVESGYYYASFEAKTLTEGKAEFNEKVYVKGGYRNINVINTDSAQIMVDVKRPFTDENGEILSNLFDVEKRWYTFADSIYEDHTTKGKGIWLVIDASKEGLLINDVYAKYNFGDFEVRQNNYNQIEVFLPLENKAGNVITLTVTDQAGNVSTITTPSIDFDATHYDIGSVLVSHSNENIPPMVTFLVGDSSDVSIAVPKSLEDIQNETFHRGQYIFIKFDNTDVYEY